MGNKNNQNVRFAKKLAAFFSSLGRKTLQFLAHLADKNLGLRLLSIFFAILMWAFVMSQDNATRSVRISGIEVEVVGMSQLAEEDLAIKQDVYELIERSVTVRLEGTKTLITELDRSRVRAVVDLTQIHSVGESVEVPISIVGADGLTATRITPYSSVTVDVEQLNSREVPVVVEFTGTLPEGYMRPGEDSFSVNPSTITVSGTSSDVTKISAARLYIDQSEMTESLNARFEYEFTDDDGNEVIAPSLTTSSSSVIVSVPVYKTKTVPVQFEGTVIGTVAAGYELESVSVNPSTVTIAGFESDLESIDRVFTRSIDIDGAQESFTTEVGFINQTGILWYSVESVEASVRIREKDTTVIIAALPLNVINELENTTTTLSVTEVTCAATGPVSYMATLLRDDVYAYVDLLSATVGRNSIAVQFRVLDEDAPDIVFSEVTVTVNIEQDETGEGGDNPS